jgi:hypothetical protein
MGVVSRSWRRAGTKMATVRASAVQIHNHDHARQELSRREFLSCGAADHVFVLL